MSYVPKIGDRVRTLGSRPGMTGYDVGTVVSSPHQHKVRVHWNRARVSYDEYIETLEPFPARSIA